MESYRLKTTPTSDIQYSDDKLDQTNAVPLNSAITPHDLQQSLSHSGDQSMLFENPTANLFLFPALHISEIEDQLNQDIGEALQSNNMLLVASLSAQKTLLQLISDSEHTQSFNDITEKIDQHPTLTTEARQHTQTLAILMYEPDRTTQDDVGIVNDNEACLANDDSLTPLHLLATVMRTITYLRHNKNNDKFSGYAVNKKWQTLNTIIHCFAASSQQNPLQFSALYEWLLAEESSIKNEAWLAAKHYEEAIKLSKTHKLLLLHAVILEHAAKHYLREGMAPSGNAIMQLAYDTYQKLGALNKAQLLLAQYNHLTPKQVQSSDGVSNQHIQHQALIRAAQALAAETSMKTLVCQFSTLLSQLVGATDVRLFSRENDIWIIQGGLHNDEHFGRLSYAAAADLGLVPADCYFLLDNTKTPLVFDNLKDELQDLDPSYFGKLKQASIAYIPIFSKGEHIASAILENRNIAECFSAERLQTATLLCSQLSVSIENSRLYESLEQQVISRTKALTKANLQLQRLSELDSLTQIANRRKFDKSWDIEVSRAYRQNQPLAVAIIDVDFFKSYNDLYGHQQGDECLKQIAQTIQSQLKRSADLVARYGGEEFIVILPTSSNVEALTQMERIRTEIEAMQSPHKGSDIGTIVTVSIGLAIAVPLKPIADNDKYYLVKRADKALYEAKQNGRNQTRVYDIESIR